MDTPVGVRQAIIAIWITLAIYAISALLAKLWGISSDSDFVGALVVYALCCIFPYKLGNRSNATRYVYLVLTVISVLFMLAGVGKLNKLDFFVSVALLPVEVFILYRLFQKEASAWFASR